MVNVTSPAPAWAPAMGPRSTAPGFRPLRRSAMALALVAAVTTGAYVYLTVGLLRQRAVLQRIDNGEPVTFAEAVDADNLVAAALALSAAASLALLVVIIVWLWRACSNIDALRAGPGRLARGWTIAAWFVPVANLVLPKRLVDDAWRAADPNARANPEWTKLPTSGVVRAWWLTFVVSGMVCWAAIAASTTNDPATAAQAKLVHALGSGLAAVAAVLAALTVHQLSVRQNQRAGELGLASPTADNDASRG